MLAAKGVIPLDYAGIAAALPGWFADASKVKNWIEHRPEIRSRRKRLRQQARDGDVALLASFAEFPLRRIIDGRSPQNSQRIAIDVLEFANQT